MSKAIYTGFALLVVGVVWSLAVPQQRLWGLHFLAYYPWPVVMVLLGLAGLVLLTGFSRVRWRGLLPELPAVMRFSPLQWDAIVALICGILFLFFSAATALLGDGQLWLNEIQAGTSDYLRNRAPLTLFLLHTLYSWLNPPTGIGAQRLFALTSVLAGAAAVMAWLKLARYVRMDRLTCILFTFAWGGIALFFGYVETYVLIAAIITWMLVLMVISVQEGEFSLFVPVLGVLAVGFNLAAVVFLPAVAAYLWRMLFKRPLTLKYVLAYCVGLIALAVLAYFGFGWYKGTDILLPLWPTTEAFGDAVFTEGHLAGLANSLGLVAGAFVVLVVAYASMEQKHGFLWDDEKLILLLALVFPLAACIMHNPQIGMARDWDICAVLLVAAPVISLVIWDSAAPFIDSPGRIRALLVVWLLLLVIPWIGVQASESRSIARFKDLLRLEPAKSESGWDYLSSYYFRRDRIDEWGQCNFEAMRYSNNPRYHANAALFFGMRRDWPNALYQAGLAHAAVMADSLITPWEREVTDPSALITLGNTYLNRAYIHDAQQAYAVAAELQPESPWPPIASTDLFVRMRRFEEAHKTVETLAKSPAGLEQARSYFKSRTEKPSLEQQLTGWLGLCLISDVTGDSVATAENARMALSLSKDEQTGQFLAQLPQVNP